MKKITIAATLIIGLGIAFTSCENKKKDGDAESHKVEKHEDHAKSEEHNEHHADAKEHVHSDGMAMATYQCPMKCEGDKTYSEAGICPTCKMDLKKVEEDESHTHESEKEEKEEH